MINALNSKEETIISLRRHRYLGLADKYMKEKNFKAAREAIFMANARPVVLIEDFYKDWPSMRAPIKRIYG